MKGAIEMKKISLLMLICVFTLLMGGCTRSGESTPAEDSSEAVSDIQEVQNDMPESAEGEIELSGQDVESINMGIHDDGHVMDVPNYYSSVSDADESGVYLGGVGGIYRIDPESGAEMLYSSQHIAGAALYKDYVFSMEYNVTDNGMTTDLIRIKKDGSDKEVLTQISAGSYDLRIIDNILVITEQILGDYGLETVFCSYTLDNEGNLASDTPQDAYTWFDLPDEYEDSMRFLINPWFSTKYLGYSCFTKAEGGMDMNSVWISRGSQEALEEAVTCSGQPLLTGDTIFHCDSNGETLIQRSLGNTQNAVLYEIPDGDSLSLLTFDSGWVYFVQRPTIDESNELSSSIMRVNMQDHRTEKIYELHPGNVMSNFNVYGNDCYFILSVADNTQWLCCDLVNGDVMNISAED